MPEIRSLTRGLIFSSLAVATMVLTGCEQPDFSNVRFKPPTVDPRAHKTAVKAYVLRRGSETPVWGTEFLHHSRSSAEQTMAPVAGTQVLLDESRPLVTDGSGLIAADGLGDGYHTFRLLHDGKSRSACFRARRDHITVALLEQLPGGQMSSSSLAVPHTFITVPATKDLIAFHEQVSGVARAYQQALSQGQLRRWEELLSSDYSDEFGGREDLLRALARDAKSGRRVKVTSFHAERDAKGQGWAVLTMSQELTDRDSAPTVDPEEESEPQGRPRVVTGRRFVRLDLAPSRGGLKVTKIQI